MNKIRDKVGVITAAAIVLVFVGGFALAVFKLFTISIGC